MKLIKSKNEIDLKKVSLTNKDGDKLFVEVSKTIYVADNAFYKTKKAKKAREK